MVVSKAQDYYPECPEPFLVSLARTGDRSAFEELVKRRQSRVRNLMRRFCNDNALADDLAQQVLLKVWLNLRQLKKISAFNGWLRKLAVNVWLHYLRKNDALKGASEIVGTERPSRESPGVGMDLDHALATLAPTLRTCVVLSYSEGMSHREIAAATGLPLGTVKTHIRNGAKQLQEVLAAYDEQKELDAS
ncbi:MAG: sigma-70 family RNA polymerase sigma factor [Gammaproteobacteria bacterium]|nr:sigma-70 family RNA polymerase sigma factor [Gammaproteobacteria bacterium]NNJ80335.1 sigma-70 family RNA polymerase sigma factor [Xanthomonadales bacterium]